jgi:predicted SnoaL-like aldol condensation-catalyzing enzyme
MTTTNKQIVTTAYRRIFGDLDVSAVDEYMSKSFIQHNPTTPDGPEGVRQLVPMFVSQGVLKQTGQREVKLPCRPGRRSIGC